MSDPLFGVLGIVVMLLGLFVLNMAPLYSSKAIFHPPLVNDNESDKENNHPDNDNCAG